jgi:two-component system cell cycle sensor histidine kinase/response regulator CckA
VKQQVTVKLDLQCELPSVAGDPKALHGVIFNLLTNAKQAMPSGGELSVRTQAISEAQLPGMVMRAEEGGQMSYKAVRLTIADTGGGISPEHVSKIFEPFFTTRRDKGGTGLGLAICHRVVTDSGGRISVKSAVGCGTEFTIDLKLWNSVPEIRRD